MLKSANAVLAEDTRRTRKLFAHYQIRNRLLSYHDFNKERLTPQIIKRLREGENLALVSDAGTPGISDPGFYIVREALKDGIAVTVVPGANSVLAALVVSGLATDSFVFEGFFPKKQGAVEKTLKVLANQRRTSIFFVSPHRLVKVLDVLKKAVPSRKLALTRELTKLHEEVVRGTAQELLDHFGKVRSRGEMVLVVAGVPREHG